MVIPAFLRWYPQRRRVRVHMAGDAPSIEGVLLRRWPRYVLALPTVLVGAEAAHRLRSPLVEIPRQRILFVERIGAPAAALPYGSAMRQALEDGSS